MNHIFLGKARPYQEILSSLGPEPHFDTRQDVAIKARAAAYACMEGKTGASQLWFTVLQECRNLGVDAIDILSIPHESGRTLAGVVMISRDWDSCQLLHGALADGVYLAGALMRQKDKLLYNLDEEDRAVGLQFLKGGARYGGEFWRGMRHDPRGVLDFNNGIIYDGRFFNGQMTGWGRSAVTWGGGAALEGLFLDGEFLGNPRTMPPSGGMRRGFLNQCRKLMDLCP